MTVSAPTSGPHAAGGIEDEPPSRLPVSVLTGFLGSGKTTVLAHLVRQPEMARVACVINEFGEVGLDHLLIARSTEDTVVLDNGCICCTVRNDLVETLVSLFMRRLRGEIPEFDRVVIETTGLADPAPILHTLMSNPLVAARYRLDGVIATVDAIHGAAQLDEHPESVKQAAIADRLVLTKSDLAMPDATAALIVRLRALNPAAVIIVAAHGAVASAALFNAGLFNPGTRTPEVGRWLNEAAYAAEREQEHDHDHACGHGCDHRHHNGHVHDRRIDSFCLIVEEAMPWERFLDFVDELIAQHGDRLLRLKGLLHVRESEVPLVIHGIQHLFHPVVPLSQWPDADRRSKLVLITRDLGQAVVAEMLHRHLSAVEVWRPEAGDDETSLDRVSAGG